MDYVKLGNTGLDVSRLCLGCMSFGVAERWIHKWVLDEEQSRLIIKKPLSSELIFLIRLMCIQTELVKRFSDELLGIMLIEMKLS